ncbi:MAG: hypothetical protein JXR76_13980 [Deltaproteobacteria bacterium]|nr:hypothetical protein [Deltaproteobacteria bacterium]
MNSPRRFLFGVDELAYRQLTMEAWAFVFTGWFELTVIAVVKVTLGTIGRH